MQTVFEGSVIPVKVALIPPSSSLPPRLGVVISDGLNDPLARWFDPALTVAIRLAQGIAVELARKYDGGEIEWADMEEVF
ncbi:MAG: hypothetical protein KKF85_02690 [Gammaproteobacteria bacterium]|nr:hypothetical protein [Rhodocyclaceae bacterium]MBU3908734.1 hypothetical protein [Gammaproteobacteria bacterium]MBU3988856.1 hypothetical protein [Gammaproteobacteria bacterium]MBU4004762.1 hypothetical protein [Gammaproteobacteria bacterium]MBU4021365.1 hypothetical protein [Gammaproteobacteria bacterium]